MRTHLLARDGTIASLMLSGDFTCLPEDGVERLAARLVGTSLEKGALEDAVAAAIEELKLDLPGLGPSDIATAILAAVVTDA